SFKAILCAGLIALVGCDRAPSPATASSKMPPVPVKTVTPLQEAVLDWDSYTGRIEATESVEVRARVSGYLEQVRFKDGDHVKKGDLLFVIDSRSYAADLKRAEAELSRSRSKLQLAQNDLKRAERLRLSKAISDEEYEARIQGQSESTATLNGAEAAVQMARLNLEFTQVRSPINGRIGRELITPGNLVSGDQTLLTHIVSVDPIYVYLDTDERAVLKYRRLSASGERSDHGDGWIIAELGLVDETGYPHKGHIDYVDPRMDPATGTLRVRGIFPNPSELLSPGLFARVRIHGGKPHPALVIPGRAIATDQDQKHVWVAKPDGAIEYRRIELGGQFGTFRAVTAGLTLSDQVVVDGLPKLRPGVKVAAERIAEPFDGQAGSN
ncbi:MAG: efflux RND transporter periplasmic adaptor subunit, partial [Methylococcaceae bacterium]